MYFNSIERYLVSEAFIREASTFLCILSFVGITLIIIGLVGILITKHKKNKIKECAYKDHMLDSRRFSIYVGKENKEQGE